MRLNVAAISKYIPKPVKPLLRPVYNYLSTRELLRKYLTPPATVQIEITTYCNLQCTGCYRTINKYPAKNKHMPLDDFKLYVEQLEPDTNIYLNGIGEPMLHPDIREIIKYARDSGRIGSIQFVTNALTGEAQMYDELFARRLSGIGISTDSLEPEEVAKLRPHTDVEQLIKNIKYLTERFPNNIKFIMVISRQNLDTFKLTIGRLVDLGAKEIGCQPFDDMGDPTLCLSFQEKYRFLEKFNEIKHDGVHLTATALFRPADQPCYNGQSPIITVEGYLAPCCRILNKDVFNLGNLKTAPLKELLSSTKARSLWAQIDKGIYPAFCEGCMSNHSEFNSSRWPERKT